MTFFRFEKILRDLAITGLIAGLIGIAIVTVVVTKFWPAGRVLGDFLIAASTDDAISHLTAPGSGWTAFTPSADTTIIFVSTTEGNDVCDGLDITPYDAETNPDHCPKKTIASGRALLRDNYPDWLLLKRGDRFVDEGVNNFLTSGRSASEPALVASYGSGPRPIVERNLKQVNVGRNYVAVVGLSFDQGASLSWLPSSQSIVVEDNYFSSGGVVFQGGGDGGRLRDVTFRRNIVVDAYSTTNAHAQGIFVDQVDNIIIEENIFDHNGWLVRQAGAALSSGPATTFNHNVYIQSTNTGVIFRNNISTRASSHGLQMRPGGTVDNNFFLENPISILFGANNSGSKPVVGGVSGTISRNLVLEGNDIDSSTQRGVGIMVTDINDQGVTVTDNIVAHNRSAQGPTAQVPVGFRHTGLGELADGSPIIGALRGTYERNIVYDWQNALQVYGVSGSTLRNVSFSDNVFVTADGARPLATVPSSPASALHFARNQYYSANANLPAGSWFQVGTALSPHLDWQAQSGETNSSTSTITFVDANVSVEQYSSLSREAFYAELRKQEKSNWRPEFTAQYLNEYFRGGLRATPPCVSSWSCSDWSLCVNDTQTRNCVDQNQCGTTEGLPVQGQDCVASLPALTNTNTSTNTSTEPISAPITTTSTATTTTPIDGTTSKKNNGRHGRSGVSSTADVTTTDTAIVMFVPEPVAPPDGSRLVKLDDSPAVYLVDDGAKQLFPSDTTFQSYGYDWSEIETIDRAELDSYATSSNVLLPDGSLVKSVEPAVYLIASGKRRHIRDEVAFFDLQFFWYNITVIDESELTAYPVGDLITDRRSVSSDLLAKIDSDNDDLADTIERLRETDITNADTDADGYPDGLEVGTGHNPLVPPAKIFWAPDHDRDGLSDFLELIFGTDALNPDTDGDGYADGLEVNHGYDPLTAAVKS